MADHQWQIYDQAYYQTYAVENPADDAFGISILVPLDAANHSTGAFRIVIYGGDEESVCIPAEEIFPDAAEALQGFFLNFPGSASSIIFPENATACNWEDVELLIRNG
jgi:hypothetical protein